MLRYLTLLLCLFSLAMQAQLTDSRIAQDLGPVSDVPVILMPEQDNKALYSAEMARRGPGIAPQFAVSLDTDISPETHGVWVQMPDGFDVWRCRISSKGAKTLNFGFDQFVMPNGGTFVIYTPDGKEVLGPFTPADNEQHEELWTPVIRGEEMVLEVRVPHQFRNMLYLHLKSVNHDFLGFMEMMSGSCNLDVICGEADGWGIVDPHRDIIQSVAVIGTSGTTFCTGFLVNNADQDCRPFFMTAHHCGITTANDQTLVAYWNFFNSTCRQPNTPASGAAGNGVLTDFNTGALLRASWATSDFTLVEFDDPVSETADAYYAGWSAEQVTPTSAVGVHHPSTDEKRISFENDPLMFSTYGGTTSSPNGDHVRVVDWDTGTTEGGSSGSPLFDQNERVVGQLHGGGAACGNNLSDYYGAFYKSWTGGGTAATRLKDWLDPDNTGILILNGRSAEQCQLFVGATPEAVNACAPSDATASVEVGGGFTGANVTVTVSGDLGGSPVYQTYSTVPGGTVNISVPVPSGVTAGSYALNLIAGDGSDEVTGLFTVNVFGEAPVACVGTSPANGATSIGTTVVLDFDGNGSSYTVQVATDENFTNIIQNIGGLTTTQAQVTLAASTIYYWRIVAANPCGDGPWSPVYTFETADITCATYPSGNVPIAISASGTPTVYSNLTISEAGAISDVNVLGVAGTHSWISDLTFTLISPAGTEVTLWGGSCTDENNFNISFDDMATGVPPCPPNDGLTYPPVLPLAVLNGEDISGTWQLRIEDAFNQDGGSLNIWSLQVCYAAGPDYGVYPMQNAEDTICTIPTTNSYNVQLGGDFDPNTLAVTASSNNPDITTEVVGTPTPGGTVSVAITLAAGVVQGPYDITVTATDGINTAVGNLEIFAVNFIEPTLVSPVNGAQTGANNTFSWSATTPAWSYRLQVSTSDAFAAFTANQVTSNTSSTVNNLAPGTYFWRLISFDYCGNSDTSDVLTFTVLNLNVALSPANQTMCNTATTTATLVFQSGFGSSGTLAANNVPAGASVTFNPNPAAPGQDVTVTYSNFVGAGAGNYSMSFVVNGNGQQASIGSVITIATAPNLSTLNLPANNANNVDALNANFGWSNINTADQYIIEIALDPLFNNMVWADTITNNTYALPVDLEANTTYYWHIILENECGASVTAPYNFTTLVSNTSDLDGNAFSLSPNPTKGNLDIRFDRAISDDLVVMLYSINGQYLGRYNFGKGTLVASIDVTHLPAAAYILRLNTNENTGTVRFIKE